MQPADTDLDQHAALRASQSFEDPREGDETEVIERDGGGGGETKRLQSQITGGDPREGDDTEVIEEGGSPQDRTRHFSGDRTESVPFG